MTTQPVPAACRLHFISSTERITSMVTALERHLPGLQVTVFGSLLTGGAEPFDLDIAWRSPQHTYELQLYPDATVTRFLELTHRYHPRLDLFIITAGGELLGRSGQGERLQPVPQPAGLLRHIHTGALWTIGTPPPLAGAFMLTHRIAEQV